MTKNRQEMLWKHLNKLKGISKNYWAIKLTQIKAICVIFQINQETN